MSWSSPSPHSCSTGAMKLLLSFATISLLPTLQAVHAATCQHVALKFMRVQPQRKSVFIDEAVAFCERHHYGDGDHVCSRFKAAITTATSEVKEEDEQSAEEFCEVMEQYLLEMRGASRISTIGSGPLVDFKLSPKCSTMVYSIIGPKRTLHAKDVPDFLYALCINQGCGHFLHSRTRWCRQNQKLTHTARVCNAAHSFASQLPASKIGDMNSSQLCQTYADFVQDMGDNIYVYEHIMNSHALKPAVVSSKGTVDASGARVSQNTRT